MAAIQIGWNQCVRKRAAVIYRSKSTVFFILQNVSICNSSLLRDSFPAKHYLSAAPNWLPHGSVFSGIVRLCSLAFYSARERWPEVARDNPQFHNVIPQSCDCKHTFAYTATHSREARGKISLSFPIGNQIRCGDLVSVTPWELVQQMNVQLWVVILMIFTQLSTRWDVIVS